MKYKRMTRDQIAGKYADLDLREKIIDLLDLRAFLRNSVIRGNYKIPDALNDAIQLSPYGKDFHRGMVQKDVPAKEARLIAFLEFFHMDLLVDADATDADALGQAVSNEIKTGNILHPFVSGPTLYDRAAELFPDERSYLGVRETLRLLEGTPAGVFHLGRWISGPLGLVDAGHRRAVRPTLEVPLQHCHDIGCPAIHTVDLSTDTTAPVNSHRSVAYKLHDQNDDDGSEFPAFFSDISKLSQESFDDAHMGALCLMIGDCLSVNELKLVLTTIGDTAAGRKRYAKFGLVSDSQTWIDGFSRAELLQLLLVTKDAEISLTLDRLIFNGDIKIPTGETRRAVFFSGASAGSFHVFPEMSQLGVRYATAIETAPLRLKRLIDERDKVNLTATEADSLSRVQDLDWQLRGLPGMNVAARLEEFLRTVSPDVAIRRLILERREHVEAACAQLGVELSAAGDLDDEVLVSRLLWKLGYDNQAPVAASEFWTRAESMAQSARAASVSTIVDQEAMRGLSANYFVSVEKMLSDSLKFTTWVLLFDHVSSNTPYAYEPIADGEWALQALRDYIDSSGGKEAITLDDNATLGSLISGFGVLASVLEQRVERREGYRRDPATYPEYAGKTALKNFPFKHNCPFLDLTEISQNAILVLLRDVASRLGSAKVSLVRNEQLHYRRSSSSLEQFQAALAAVEDSVRALESAGLTLEVFYPDRREYDRWHRSTVYFSDRRGREIAFGRPSQFTWLSLPPLGEPQLLVGCAQFAEPNEILRVSLTGKSEFTRMYADLPKRRRAATRIDTMHRSGVEVSGQGSVGGSEFRLDS